MSEKDRVRYWALALGYDPANPASWPAAATRLAEVETRAGSDAAKREFIRLTSKS